MAVIERRLTTLSLPLVVGPPRRRAYLGAKRAVDIGLSAALLVVASPLLALTAVAVKLDSRGPALFVQARIGSRRRTVDGRQAWEITEFPLLKFRTMVDGCDSAVHRRHMEAYINGHRDPEPGSAEPDEDGQANYKLQNDTRITRVGRFLRQTSLDELPQLINVLRGDMSLVGPRPPLAYEVSLFDPRHLDRFASRPGITGLAQVDGRCSLTFQEMIDRDLEYVANSSLTNDARILVKTVGVVLSRQGAG